MKQHVVSERYVCKPCLKGQHGDCERVVGGMLNLPRACHCQRYKHNVLIREQQPVHKSRGKPKSWGTSGEIAAAQALTNAGLKFKMQVPIQTRFREWPFLVDFLIEDRVVYEVQGGFHRKTWGGGVANFRMEKDRVKANCLKAEGYAFVESSDKEIKKSSCSVLYRIHDAIKNPEKYMQIDPLVRAELEENKQ